MGQGNIVQHRRYVGFAYVFMFFALLTVVCAALAYLLARKVAIVDDTEVWLHAHGLRCVLRRKVFGRLRQQEATQ